MKNFTSLMTVGLLAIGTASAFAQADFTKSDFDFWTTHRTTPVIADFNNSGYLDIFYSGQGNNLFNEMDWWWQIQANLCINKGDGTFEIDGLRGEDNGSGGYDRIWSNHGIKPASFSQHAALDYNNDGLVDLLVYGKLEWDVFDYGGTFTEDQRNYGFLELYKNLGDGKFELVNSASFPGMSANGFYSHAIAVGDYDRDGYVDIIVSVNSPSSTIKLYKNISGTGEFQEMNFEGFESVGGGNVHFADLNNDGWLDIIADGYNDGNVAKIYLNENGENFVDVTSESNQFYTLRNSGSNVADFDQDGYLDYFMTGWGDNGVNWESFLFFNLGEDALIYEEPVKSAQTGLPQTENCLQIARDFNNDGELDIYYSGREDCQIFYGQQDGSFEKGSGLPSYGTDGYAAVGDFNKNGLSDIFFTPYGNVSLYLNNGNKVDSPEAPENVVYSLSDGLLTVNWDEVEDAAKAGLAYNIYVKKNDGSIITLVPANPENGFVKVGDGRVVALRPDVTTYSLPCTEEEFVEAGVQTISLYNETYSAFTVAQLDPSSAIATETISSFCVNVTENGILVSGGNGNVTVYDLTGRVIAKGVAGKAINLEAKGVYIVTDGNNKAKVIK